MPKLSLDLGKTELATLLFMLEELGDQQVALSTLRHATKAERDEYARRALICQIVREQLKG